MNKLWELKDNLKEELERYADVKVLDAATLNTIDTLAHACKNVCKIIDHCEEHGREYSGSYSMTVDRMRPVETEFHMNLRNLINTAPNEHVRQKLASVMNEV